MSLSFGFLSTYPPTQCGLATFTQSLSTHLVAAGNRSGVVRIVDEPEAFPALEVVHHLVRDSRGAAAGAAQALAPFDVAVVQHEFGIYGGIDGAEVLEVLAQLDMPVIVVAHTVLTSPTPHQREVFEQVIRRADAVVTMSETARGRLCDGYERRPQQGRRDPARCAPAPPDRHRAAEDGAADDPHLGPARARARASSR